jgi:hypothetical protein
MDFKKNKGYLTFEEFKDYRKKCQNPELLSKDNHYYKMAVK